MIPLHVAGTSAACTIWGFRRIPTLDAHAWTNRRPVLRFSNRATENCYIVADEALDLGIVAAILG
jgi:hypothetical protein